MDEIDKEYIYVILWIVAWLEYNTNNVENIGGVCSYAR